MPTVQFVFPRDRGAAVTTIEVSASTGSARDDGLTAVEAEILEFERQWWRLAGAKEQAIRDRFGLSSTRYHQQLNALLDSPAALRADPMLVKRLQRIRSSRERDRSARRLDREA
jgi:hypothetical protein